MQSASCVKRSQIMILYFVMGHVIVLSTKNALILHWTVTIVCSTHSSCECLESYELDCFFKKLICSLIDNLQFLQVIRAGFANFASVRWKFLTQ